MQLKAGAIRAAVIAAIVLVVVGAASATPWVVTLPVPRIDEPERTVTPSLQPSSAAPTPLSVEERAAAYEVGGWLTLLVVVAVATLVGYLLYRLIRRQQQRLSLPGQSESDQPAAGAGLAEGIDADLAAIATAVERAEAHLAGIAEPGDAVIAAWVALEHEAELQGTRRHPTQTSTEFTTALLARTAAPEQAVHVLRGLYQQARFSSRPVAAADVARARQAIGQIADALDSTTTATKGAS